ncbi:reverse transcriptase [Blumeria hordei DH14]|uniref:Reverse transcriptase n=1 Tax=Blumeria graminis f. sp. hordei (strain DH14) TaxID=546991 RepID=N1JA52_BLUG1|nr:reverse transcriptase [Blumeria hordei DH14]
MALRATSNSKEMNKRFTTFICKNPGVGYSIRRGATHEIACGTIPPCASAEVYDVEISGAIEGLAAALHNPMVFYATNVTIYRDNHEAALQLPLLTPTAASFRHIAKFRQLAASWTNRTRASCTRAGAVSDRWCSGNSGIPGNKAADFLVKSACLMTAPLLPLSMVRAKRKISLLYNTFTTAYWFQEELKGLNRRALRALIAARSGHGDLAQYHRCFAHEDALMTCSCGEKKSPDHFFYCSIGRNRARLCGGPRHPHSGIRWILGTPEGALAFGK